MTYPNSILNRAILPLFFFLSYLPFSHAQMPKRWTSDDIQMGIEKLQTLGSVMYIAAHPDDENTRLISLMSNDRKFETTYLSLTRGDGGQNLIGTETGDALGVLRTQELLEARKIDGGKQLFSTAVDFGFSKNIKETFEFWNKDSILADVVWAIRKTRPDVIITRFHPGSDGKTHGHHTASAILAMEAFDLAGKSDAFPEQLKYVSTWQPKRVFFNTSWFFYGSKEEFDAADKSNLLSVDIGVYLPMKGLSNNEIAALSRSKHRCQGFGSSLARGQDVDYLELLAGDKAVGDLMDGVNTKWSRLENGKYIEIALQQIHDSFNHADPSASIPALLALRKQISEIKDSYWVKYKMAELREIILACGGIYIESTLSSQAVSPGDNAQFKMEITNRSSFPMKLNTLQIIPSVFDTAFQTTISVNQKLNWSKSFTIPVGLPYSTPYWLNNQKKAGRYNVPDQLVRGLPESKLDLQSIWTIKLGDDTLQIQRPVVYKMTDPSIGESYQNLAVQPPFFLHLDQSVMMFADQSAKPIEVNVEAAKNKAKGTVRLKVPKGWQIEPAELRFDIELKGDHQRLVFKVIPTHNDEIGELYAEGFDASGTYSLDRTKITYPHITEQNILVEAKAKIVRLSLKKKGERIAYVMGAGDEMPQYLRQIGYQVDLIGAEQLNQATLKNYDAVIVGIRAYNTVTQLKYKQADLIAYATAGGTVIVQYNTSAELVTPNLGPFPFKISRERVTDENATVTFLLPEHTVLNQPNKISSKDFDGWVQERGLYFPESWDPAYDAILACNDPGEPAAKGGLLVAKIGKGHYVYSSLAWFRELPAGVPGAYRLFANLLSLGK